LLSPELDGKPQEILRRRGSCVSHGRDPASAGSGRDQGPWIAGNRFFVGTLTFDDPAVADEAILPGYSGLYRPAEGGNVFQFFLFSRSELRQ
jgi:hypothetical protein